MNTDDLIQLILAVGITCGALGAIWPRRGLTTDREAPAAISRHCR